MQPSAYPRFATRPKRAEVSGKILDRYKFYILRKLEPSIGYDIALLDEAERLGATIARNRDRQTGISYLAPIARIRELGFIVDRGYGVQIMLPVRLWDRVNVDGTSQDAQPVQADLFAEVA